MDGQKTMSKRDYYEVIGASKSDDAKAIKRAYRKLAMKYHPDRNPDDKEAEHKFKEATEAYEILSDESKRQAYDQYGHAGVDPQAGGFGGGGGNGNFGDIFGDVFGDIFGGGGRGGQRNGPQRGSDLKYNLELTLEQAMSVTLVMARVPKMAASLWPVIPVMARAKYVCSRVSSLCSRRVPLVADRVQSLKILVIAVMVKVLKKALRPLTLKFQRALITAIAFA